MTEANIFGTDGIRDRAGVGHLAPEALHRLGTALVRFVQGSEPNRRVRVLFGRDPRISGPEIEARLTAAITAAGGETTHAGVLPTPGVSLLAQHGDHDLGIVVSASHNPPEYNGVKVLNHEGKKLMVSQELEITRETQEAAAGAPELQPIEVDSRLRDQYQDRLVASLAGDNPGGDRPLTGLKVALDCARGAAAEIAPVVFRRLGAEVVAINDVEDGTSINQQCGSLHTEDLQALVREHSADLGVAFDGDGDRAILVDERGQVVDGDEMMTLWSLELRGRGELNGDTLVATVMSNAGMERYLKEQGVRMLRASVGDREVFQAMIEGDYVLGGEQSGHVIFHREANTGDGIRTGLHLARLVQRSGRPLSALRAEIPRYPQVLLGVEVTDKPPLESLPEVAEATRLAEAELKDMGRVLLRYSGTEPLARVLVEGPDQDVIDRLAHQIADAIRRSV